MTNVLFLALSNLTVQGMYSVRVNLAPGIVRVADLAEYVVRYIGYM